MFEGLPDSAQRAQMSDTEIAEAVTEWTRAQACAGAHRLLFIGELTTRKYNADWEIAEEGSDNWDATAAEVSTASGISQGRAGTDMEVGIALTARLPKIAALLLAGQISEYLVRRITKRTELIQDPELLAKVEDAIAERAIQWGALSQKNLDAAIDLWVDRFDPGALKHTRARVRGRGVDVVNSQDGITEILLRLRGADAALLIRRITLMAQGVCKDDPRTLAQRKADAHGALGAGYFHLACECGNPDCEAAGDDDGRASSVTVYVYAEKESLAAQPDPLMDGQDPPGDRRPAGEPWPPHEPVPAPTPAAEEGSEAGSEEVGESEPGPECPARPESQGQAEATGVQDGPQLTPVVDGAVDDTEVAVAEQDSPASVDGSPAESTTSTSAPEDPPGDDPPDYGPSEGDTPPDPPDSPGPPPPPSSVAESPPPASTPGRPTPPPDPPAPPPDLPTSPSPPAGLIVGYGIVPAPLLAALITRGATVRHLTPPRTDPEARYRPSVKLDEWVRARDLTCRFPNCDRPAEYCDWDHTVPWPAGPTHASGGKLLCRKHHQLKTFDSGWTDVQHPDGTVVWTTPSGQTFTTKPGANLFFPNVETTSAPIEPGRSIPNSRDKKLKKPTRQRSHAKQREYRIKAERALNDAHVAEQQNWPF